MPRSSRWPGALLLPFTLAFCGDALPTCGGGGDRRVEVPASGTITLSGAASATVEATGIMTRWDGLGNTFAWSLSLGGAGAATPPTVLVGLGASTPYLSGSQADLRLGAPAEEGHVSATATTPAGGYLALDGWPGAEGRVHFESLDPPHGNAHFVLVPGAIDAVTTPGPAGTTVVLDAVF